jgi:hypothetical protein
MLGKEVNFIDKPRILGVMGVITKNKIQRKLKDQATTVEYPPNHACGDYRVFTARVDCVITSGAIIWLSKCHMPWKLKARGVITSKCNIRGMLKDHRKSDGCRITSKSGL